MPKLIWLLLDGLGYQAACNYMCYPAALCESGLARRFYIRSVLPPLSRPVYATYISGLNPLDHGILHNDAKSGALFPNIFTQARAAGKTCCAAAYHWFFELAMGIRFEPGTCRHWHNAAAPIQHGLFYWNDRYPDPELFADGSDLIRKYGPDLILIHPMGIDWAGHEFGSQSSQYIQAVQSMDILLSEYCPEWLARGYGLAITGDHGMDANGCHHNASAEARDTVWWVAGAGWDVEGEAQQKSLAGIMASYLRL